MWSKFNASLAAFSGMTRVFWPSDLRLYGCHSQGVMEAIRISCAGYPTRKNFDEFVQRFTILEPKILKAWYFHPFPYFVLPFPVI